ncbi:MAG: universal stress protein [Hyphomicrobiaceae bacterium]
MFKNILIPTDGTEFCERAIRKGVALATLCQAKVIGLTVSMPLHTGTPEALIPAQLASVLKTESAKAATEKLAAVEQIAKEAGVACETLKANRDHPWEAIIETAQARGCDLIVMASHGRRGVSAIILGSETQKVLTHSTIPVLVVR